MQIFGNGKWRFYTFMEFYVIPLKFKGGRNLIIVHSGWAARELLVCGGSKSHLLVNNNCNYSKNTQTCQVILVMSANCFQ